MLISLEATTTAPSLLTVTIQDISDLHVPRLDIHCLSLKCYCLLHQTIERIHVHIHVVVGGSAIFCFVFVIFNLLLLILFH